MENFQEAETLLGNKDPDLVIFDLETRDQNGLDIIKKVKNSPDLQSVPLLVLTANQDPDMRTRAFGLGVDDYIYKPFEISDLLVRVKYLIKIHIYQKMLAERNNVIEKELDIARMLQAKLLPKNIPDVPGCEISATYIPMDKVGGDYYDLSLRNGTLDIFIADASGHGIPAAFLTSLCKMAFQFYVDQVKTCDELIRHMDRAVNERSVKNLYVTALFARLDLDRQILTYSNAGHCPLLLHRREPDEILSLEQVSLPLGSLFGHGKKNDTLYYKENAIQLGPGDRLLFYTDGITECQDKEKNLFGMPRLSEFFHKHSGAPANAFSLKLVEELYRFAGTSSLNDDLAFLVIDIGKNS